MRNFTILAVLLLALSLTNNAYAVVEISDGSVKALYHLSDEVDSSGAGLNFTNSNASFDTGKLDNAVSINPASDYLTNTSVNSLKLGTSSISFWIKSDNAANVCAISQTNTGDNKFNISVNAGAMEITQYSSGGSPSRVVTGNTTISNGTWYHIVADMNQDIMRLWINDVFQTSSVASLTWNYNSNVAFRIGTRVEGCSQFTGMIDELAIISGNIGTTTRAALYNAGAGDEICVTAGCGTTSTPSSTATSSMTIFETFIAYEIILSVIVATSIGTYTLLT